MWSYVCMYKACHYIDIMGSEKYVWQENEIAIISIIVGLLFGFVKAFLQINKNYQIKGQFK